MLNKHQIFTDAIHHTRGGHMEAFKQLTEAPIVHARNKREKLRIGDRPEMNPISDNRPDGCSGRYICS